MSCPIDEPNAVVEPKPEGGHHDPAAHVLHQRIRQQALLAELGVLALQGTPFQELLDATAKLTAAGLNAEFCKVLEFIASQNRFLVRAGVGWKPEIVGIATVGADLASPAGFALHTGKPVISNHLENEQRFRTPELLVEHGIRRAMNVVLQGDGSPFGVLEVDSRSEGEFVEHDLAFLQGAANILGMALERQRYERRLTAALDQHKVLLKEVDHRVKNSLQLVVSMLRLQASSVRDPLLTGHLDEASSRVSAIARAHERLYQNNEVERLDLGEYLKDICGDLDSTVSHCDVRIDSPSGIEISTDRAIPLALTVVELVTNAAKHAYRSHVGGVIWVRVARTGPDAVRVSVEDAGVGLPAGFDPATSKGLGMRIVMGFAQQLKAGISVQTGAPQSGAPGTKFLVSLQLLAQD